MLSLRFHFLPLVVVLCFASAPAAANPFTQLFVFGDSLSDVGNVSQASFGIVPGSHYFGGRFSNGPNYSETLATGLNLSPLTHSRSGGNNFAHGGAETDGNGGLIIQDVNDQVDDFLASRTGDPNALYVVFAGANDLLSGQTNVNVPVGNLITEIGRLITDGAQNLMVANLPLLGLTPRFNGDPIQLANMSQITSSFNATLASQLDTLELGTPSLNLFRLDVEQIISDVASNPALFGLTNATDSAAPGLDPGDLFYNENQIVPNPESYLFWDDLHPTTAAHAMLGQFALDAVTFSADFNFDGSVDQLDLTNWETAYAANSLADADGDGDSDGNDFLQWQQQAGSGAGPVLANSMSVPEPSSLLLFMLAIGTSWHFSRNLPRNPGERRNSRTLICTYPR